MKAGDGRRRLFCLTENAMDGSIEIPKVALYLPSLRGGGAERVMLTLAKGFLDKGLRVDLVLVAAEGPYLEQVPQGVRIIDLRSKRSLASLPGLIRYMRSERPQAMLSTLTHTNILALWARRLARIQLRLVVRQSENPSLGLENLPALRALRYRKILKWSYSWADGIAVVSQGVGEELVKSFKLNRDLVTIVYNPVVTNDLTQKSLMPVAHPWFQNTGLPIVLSAGRLAWEKDFSTLIRAFKLVRQEIPAKLVILGEGEERQKLTNLIEELDLKEDVDLPGFVLNPYPYMAHSSVFVLSSKYEGLPNVLIQAMAVGTPVIATDCKSGPEEILEKGKYGGLVPVGDHDIMSREILKVLNNYETYKQKISQIINRANLYNADNIINKYLACLQV